MPDKTSKKPLSPLQAMSLDTKKFSLDEVIPRTSPSESDKATYTSTISSEIIISVDPDEINNWEFSDRLESELGNIEDLATDLRITGQIQPCIVRPIHNRAEHKYELIVGERRWRAAKLAEIKLKVIVKNLTDQDAAIYQVEENDQRKDLSDYAKGISYHKLIEHGILTRQQLQARLNKSKSYIRNILAFARLPKEIIDAIGDISQLSATTVYEITRILEKGDEYRKALLEVAPRLNGKNINAKKIASLVESVISISKKIDESKKVRTIDGRHLFTWRNDSNGNKSITFPQNIRDKINFEQLEKNICEHIEDQLRMFFAEKGITVG